MENREQKWLNDVFGEPPNTAGQRPTLPNENESVKTIIFGVSICLNAHCAKKDGVATAVADLF